MVGTKKSAQKHPSPSNRIVSVGSCVLKQFTQFLLSTQIFQHFQMKNRIMCRVCGKSHPRLATDRSMFAARYCSECGVRHSAKEVKDFRHLSTVSAKAVFILYVGSPNLTLPVNFPCEEKPD